ncbi:ABC transporter permease [Thermodesulfobacteriota bacterium]
MESDARYHILDEKEGTLVLGLQGRLDGNAHASLSEEIGRLVRERRDARVVIDLSRVSYVDDSGALLLAELYRAAMNRNAHCILAGAHSNVQDVLDLLQFQAICTAPPRARKKLPNPLVGLGEAVIRHLNDLKYAVSFTGSTLLALAHVARKPRDLRWDDALVAMRTVGVDAVPIVGLISFLLGLIIAFMSSVQLEQFGANIFVASLVSLAMVRELGPIMTAIIVAGRSGSAFASEIGTMKISEEVDALFTMGFDPTLFLVTPKVVAAIVVVPLLTLFADAFAIFGGMTVGVLMLDLTVENYITQSFDALRLTDLFWSFGKGMVFALLITWIGCLRGFQTRRHHPLF